MPLLTSLSLPLKLTSCLDFIKKARRSAISSLLQPLVDMFKTWSECKNPDGLPHEQCISILLGTMIRCLCREGLWPLPKDPVHHGIVISAQKLGKITKDIDTTLRDTLSYCKTRRHHNCRITRDHYGLDQVLKPLKVTTWQMFVTQFKTQATKSGCEIWLRNLEGLWYTKPLTL